AELLRRCRDLARQDDPDNGVTRLHRMMLRRGVEEPTIVAALIQQAQARDTGLCPHCWGFVTPLELRVPEPLVLDDEVLEGGGYRLLVSDRGMVPTLRVEPPEDLLYNGREPGRGLSALGRLVIVVLPGVALLFVLMQGLAHGTLPSWILLMIAGGIGIVA